jgi:hypothetical protein
VIPERGNQHRKFRLNYFGQALVRSAIRGSELFLSHSHRDQTVDLLLKRRDERDQIYSFCREGFTMGIMDMRRDADPSHQSASKLSDDGPASTSSSLQGTLPIKR